MVAGAAGGAVSDGAAELGDAPGPVPGMAVVLAAPGAAVPAAVVSDGRAGAAGPVIFARSELSIWDAA